MNKDTEKKIADTLDALTNLFAMDPYTNPMELIFKAIRDSEFPTERKKGPIGNVYVKMNFTDLSHGDLVKALEMYTNPRNGHIK